MALIPYPDVPIGPGVPTVPRLGLIPGAIADLSNIVSFAASLQSAATLAIDIGAVTQVLANALQSAPAWGIFDQSGNPLGASTDTNATLSTLDVDYVKEMRVSDFPIEQGGFASYNKVELPATPRVTLILDGTVDDRAAFLNAIDAACKSTNLYNIVTPEAFYLGYSLERYSYRRTASRGANLLVVEIAVKEIRSVNATYTTVTPGPINSPQSPGATPQAAGGMVQSPSAAPSTLRGLINLFPSLGSAN